MTDEQADPRTTTDEFSDDRGVWTQVLPFLIWGFGAHVIESLTNRPLLAFLAGGMAAAWAFWQWKPWRYSVTASHVLPFVLWMFLLTGLGDPAAWKYAVRSVVCLIAFLAYRPWRWYPALHLKNLPLATLVGLAVFVIWVLPESTLADRTPALRDFYLRWAIMVPGKMPAPLEGRPYAPEVCGWPLTLMRLFGSAFVIAIIEEFFWRGFLYRWLIQRRFIDVDLGRMQVGLFLLVALFFGVEHNRYLAGAVAGLAYGWLLIRTRDVWATCIAHVITNFVLALYVLASDNYAFW